MRQCPSFVLLFVIQKVQIALLAFLTFELMTVAFDFFPQKQWLHEFLRISVEERSFPLYPLLVKRWNFR